MKYLICAAVLLLAGCVVDGWEINKAVAVCADHGGVDYYDPAGQVACNDGTVFYIEQEY